MRQFYLLYFLVTHHSPHPHLFAATPCFCCFRFFHTQLFTSTCSLSLSLLLLFCAFATLLRFYLLFLYVVSSMDFRLGSSFHLLDIDGNSKRIHIEITHTLVKWAGRFIENTKSKMQEYEKNDSHPIKDKLWKLKLLLSIGMYFYSSDFFIFSLLRRALHI